MPEMKDRKPRGRPSGELPTRSGTVPGFGHPASDGAASISFDLSDLDRHAGQLARLDSLLALFEIPEEDAFAAKLVAEAIEHRRRMVKEDQARIVARAWQVIDRMRSRG